MEDASPTRWHLAHTTWFFERFVLTQFVADYRAFNDAFFYLFNSYYTSAGPMHTRARRGQLSRPTVAEVFAYRAAVDQAMERFLMSAEGQDAAADLVELGIHHEQQHQELMVTDLKYNLSVNPMLPAYQPFAPRERRIAPELGWVAHPGGLVEIGHAGSDFCYDNETPRHRVYLEPFEVATRLTTNAEYQAFVEDGGYTRPELWLSLGWSTVQAQGLTHPLYWYQEDGRWMQYTLAGPLPLHPDEPACHLCYFEADAFARWSGARLATEAEWETVAADQPVRGVFHEDGRFHPSIANLGQSPHQLYGDLWEWTSSPYTPYPGFAPLPGAVGEYNGKFMCNQFVLRGGSCATPASHIRTTYRNFFPPEARWQFSGVRLARGIS